MPYFSVRLVPVTGGYALHQAECDCHGTDAPGRSRVMLVGSAHEALAHMHTGRPGGIAQNARLDHRECAARVPLHALPPMPWGHGHSHYLREAAMSIHQQADQASDACHTGAAAIASSQHDEDRLVMFPFWQPSRGQIRSQIRNSYTAQQLHLCLRGVRDPSAQPERVVAQAEEVYQQELRVLLTETSQHCDSLDAAWAHVEHTARVQLVDSLRRALSPVVAHRVLRDVVTYK